MALKQLNKLTYGTLTSLAPALAALTGFLLLHEEISMLQWVALACVMLASIGVTFKKQNSIIGVAYCCFLYFLYSFKYLLPSVSFSLSLRILPAC